MDSIIDHLVPQISEKMFKTLKKLFEHSSINVTLTLRNKLSNMKMTKSENIASYFMRITELRDKLNSSGDSLEEKDLVMTTLNGIPPYWESFIQTISGRTKFPKFDKLWEECTQEETLIVARQRLHGTQPKENQAFVSHAKKGKGRVRKYYNHKHQDKRSSSPPDQKKQKKDLSQIQCYRCKKYSHYASSCQSSHKRKHEDSIVDVEEDPPHKEPRKDDRSEFFF